MRFSTVLFQLVILCWLLSVPQWLRAQRDTIPDKLITISADSTGLENAADNAILPTIDSLTQKKFRFRLFQKKDGLPIPKNAVILSAIVPGAGQIYNGKWWKTPIIYGGLSALAYSIDYNNRNYIITRDAYKRALRGLPHRYTGDNVLDDTNVLKSRRDRFDKNLQFSYFGFVGLWIIQSAEAFVNAHLLNFDVSDDLSLHLQPSLQINSFGEPIQGIGLSFVFK